MTHIDGIYRNPDGPLSKETYRSGLSVQFSSPPVLPPDAEIRKRESLFFLFNYLQN